MLDIAPIVEKLTPDFIRKVFDTQSFVIPSRDCKGRVFVKRLPSNSMTDGRHGKAIILPDNAKEVRNCLAIVVKLDEVQAQEEGFSVGDVVMAPEYVFSSIIDALNQGMPSDEPLVSCCNCSDISALIRMGGVQ